MVLSVDFDCVSFVCCFVVFVFLCVIVVLVCVVVVCLFCLNFVGAGVLCLCFMSVVAR